MKKLILLFSLVFLVACGTGEVQESENDNDENESAAAVSAASVAEEDEPVDESTEEEEVEEVIPTERTTDIEGNYPWQYYAEDYIADMQMSGQVVFLLDDAEALEEHIIQSASREPEDEEMEENKKLSAESFAEHIELFLNDVEPYIDSDDYVEKLQEVQQALKNHDYESVIDLTEEAKELRENG